MLLLGNLIYYLLVGKPLDFVSADTYQLIQLPTWRSLVNLLTLKDCEKRLHSNRLLEHPAFWNDNPKKIFNFIQKLYLNKDVIGLNEISIKYSISNIDLFSDNSWKTSIPIEVYQMVPEYKLYNENKICDLLSFILYVVKHLYDESPDDLLQERKSTLSYFRALKPSFADHPILYFQFRFRSLIPKLWESVYFAQQELILKQKIIENLLLDKSTREF